MSSLLLRLCLFFHTQVYQGSSTSHRITGLSPNSSYSIRVCPVRVCKGDTDSIPGAYSPSTTFKTKNLPPVIELKKTEVQPVQQSIVKRKVQEIITAIKPERDHQYALAFLLLMFLIGVAGAGLLHYLLGWSNSHRGARDVISQAKPDVNSQSKCIYCNPFHDFILLTWVRCVYFLFSGQNFEWWWIMKCPHVSLISDLKRRLFNNTSASSYIIHLDEFWTFFLENRVNYCVWLTTNYEK